jgi:hypothetical protein
MSRPRDDTRPDGLKRPGRPVDSERGSHPGSPPETMINPGPRAASSIAASLPEHPTPVGSAVEAISEDLVDETVMAFERAAKKGVVFTPKAGASVPDTSSVGMDERHALAYWSGRRHSLRIGHPTPLPAETMIVSRTPANARQLDSLRSDPADCQRDVPTLVPPPKRLRALLRPPIAVPIGVFMAVTVAGTLLVVLMMRRQPGDAGRAAEPLEGPAISESGAASTAIPSPRAPAATRSRESESAIAAVGASESNTPPLPIAVAPRAPAVDHPAASRHGPKPAAPLRSSGPPPTPKPPGEKNVMVDEL